MGKRRLYVNARFLLQRPTGVMRYGYEMCRAIVRTEAEVVMICPEDGIINDAYDTSGFRIVRFGIGRSHLWEQLVLPFFFIGKNNYLLLNFTGLGPVLIHHKVITVHDISFLVNPAWFSKPYYYCYRVMTPLVMKTSELIITVSEFSKHEILRFYGHILPEKVKVIYNAVNKDVFSSGRHCIAGDEPPYILVVSSLDPRKNLFRLIQSFQEIDNCRLKVVGGGNSIFNFGEIETNHNVDYLGYIPDIELRRLYTNAVAFIYPSLYEGFGLPPIEAMACGCPVLVSDIPVLREICGNAAMYFDPLNSHSICDAIGRVFGISPEEREQMIERGMDNIQRFSWDKSAGILLIALNDIN